MVRGQIVLLKDLKHMIYLCSPYVTSVRDLLDHGLHLSDIPLHDATRNLILLNQSRMSQVEIKFVQFYSELKMIFYKNF